MTSNGGQGPGGRPPRRNDAAARSRSTAAGASCEEQEPLAAAPPADPPPQPSLGGGTPAQGRALGRQGLKTVSKLLEAGLAEFDENGFNAVRVDDVVRRAKISHGTFYL